MAEINVSGFNVPETPYREYGGTQDFVNTVLQNRRFEYQKQKEQEADDWRKYQVVKGEIDPSQIATGQITADQYFDNEAKRVMNEVITDPNIRNMSYVDLYATIQRKWQPVVAASNKVKSGLGLIDASVKAEGTGNPNLSVDDLARDAKLSLINDIIPADANGKRNYDISNYRPERDYVGDILNSEHGWRYLKSGNALIDYIKNFKTTEVYPHKQLGDQSIIPYKGRKTPFVKLNVEPNEIGRFKNSDNPQYDIVVEDDFVTDDNGEKIRLKVLGKDIYEQHILGNKKNREALDFLWNTYKERSGLVSKNATEDEKRKRAFAVGIFQLNDPSEITEMTPQHLPRNTTNNYINTGGGTAGIAKGNLIDKIDLAYYGNPQNGRIDDADAKIIPADLQAVLKASGIDISEAETFKIEIENGKVIAITPSGGKRIDRTAVENAQKKFNTEAQKQPQPDFETVIPTVVQPGGGQPRPKNKTFNVIDPKTGKVILSGVSEADANKAKAKGYKIQ